MFPNEKPNGMLCGNSTTQRSMSVLSALKQINIVHVLKILLCELLILRRIHVISPWNEPLRYPKKYAFAQNAGCGGSLLNGAVAIALVVVAAEHGKICEDRQIFQFQFIELKIWFMLRYLI